MRKIYTLLLFCTGLLFLAACEELVEVDFPNNQIGTTQVFEDLKTANAALGGVYAKLRDYSFITGGSYIGIGPLTGTYTDELDCYYYDQNGVVDFYQNQIQETNTTIESIWETSYQLIYYANSTIYGAVNSTALSEDDKNRIKGEALALRSLIYFYLQQLFGDIPYTASLDYEYNRTLFKTEATAVLEQLAADVIEAVGLLQDDYRDAERIYVNRKAAQLLLARIYLLQEKWSLAEQMAETILESTLYEFQPDINEVFHKSGRHILWQLEPENSGDQTTEASFYYFDNSEPNNFVLTQNLVDAFSVEDLRRQAWMTEVTHNEDTWYRPYKYKNLAGTNTNECSIILRLEEAYFIMAESLAKQDRVEEALPYLNATRERAGLTAFTSQSAEAFINELVAEKRREFFTEFGHRFSDLKRFGRLDDLTVLKSNWEDYMQVWPLPQGEMLLNPNLSPQNTGY